MAKCGGNTISMVFVGSRDLGWRFLCVCTYIIHFLGGGICFSGLLQRNLGLANIGGGLVWLSHSHRSFALSSLPT
jgi:hypothetical protein